MWPDRVQIGARQALRLPRNDISREWRKASSFLTLPWGWGAPRPLCPARRGCLDIGLCSGCGKGGASFETAALRPPQDEEGLRWAGAESLCVLRDGRASRPPQDEEGLGIFGGESRCVLRDGRVSRPPQDEDGLGRLRPPWDEEGRGGCGPLRMRRVRGGVRGLSRGRRVR